MAGATAVIAIERPEAADVRALIDAARAYSASLYPAESNHGLGVEALAGADVTLLVARLNGTAVGSGALVQLPDGDVELKAMWVDPRHRGSGVGRMLLARLEGQAQAAGARHIRLETGIHQLEALSLYRAAGFAETGPFAPYRPDPLSVFMAKSLPEAA